MSKTIIGVSESDVDDLDAALVIALRKSPNLLVIHCPMKATESHFNVIRKAYLVGVEIQLVNFKKSAPIRTTWIVSN